MDPCVVRVVNFGGDPALQVTTFTQFTRATGHIPLMGTGHFGAGDVRIRTKSWRKALARSVVNTVA